MSPQKPGRPRVEEPQTSLSTRLPASEYDRLVKVAARHGLSLQELTRRVLLAQPFMKPPGA